MPRHTNVRFHVKNSPSFLGRSSPTLPAGHAHPPNSGNTSSLQREGVKATAGRHPECPRFLAPHVILFCAQNEYLEIMVFSRAHGVAVSHPLRMRKALGSIPSVSISMSLQIANLKAQHPQYDIHAAKQLPGSRMSSHPIGDTYSNHRSKRPRYNVKCGILPKTKRLRSEMVVPKLKKHEKHDAGFT